MYKFELPAIPGMGDMTVRRSTDNASIPLSDTNRDCIQFLMDWKSGAAGVQNSDASPALYSDAAVLALGLEPPA
jgi:hypothetical protein